MHSGFGPKGCSVGGSKPEPIVAFPYDAGDQSRFAVAGDRRSGHLDEIAGCDPHLLVIDEPTRPEVHGELSRGRAQQELNAVVPALSVADLLDRKHLTGNVPSAMDDSQEPPGEGRARQGQE